MLLEKDPADDKSLSAFESILAQHGHQLAETQATAAADLISQLHDIFYELTSNSLPLEAQFVGCLQHDAAGYLRQLHASRTIDRHRGRATFGPHRDDLELYLAGQTARQHASQGQQRLLALAIKLAELRCIKVSRNLDPVLLLDDIVSELDPNRTIDVFAWLEHTRSQIFISAPRDDVLSSSIFRTKEQRVFVVKEGALHHRTSEAS